MLQTPSLQFGGVAGRRRCVVQASRQEPGKVQAAAQQSVSMNGDQKDASKVKKKAASQDFSYKYPGVTESVLAIILGGGKGSRLYPLTAQRAKPAVPLGGNFRLIDIPVSNCLNSSINKIYCLTQFNSASLNRHINNAYTAAVGGVNGGFVEMVAASQTKFNTNWFQGTSDAVRQYLWLFGDNKGVEDYIILAGDHLYRCNYQDFIRAHRESDADITISALPCDEEQAQAFGLMKIDDTGRIIDFAEKPTGEKLKSMQVDTTVLGLDEERAKKNPYIASMGIYVVKKSSIHKLLVEEFPDAHDFGNDIIPAAKNSGMKVQAYLFDGYWEDIGTIKSFFNANLAMADPDKVKFSLYDNQAEVITMRRFLPPAKVVNSHIEKAILGDGTSVQANTNIKNAVVGVRTTIMENCTIENALIMGADYFERPEECVLLPNCYPIGIGANCVLRNVIIDKNARIGTDVKLVNEKGVQESNEHEKMGILIKDGIIIVCKDAQIENGFTL